jgi:hypothetical protein
MATLQQQTIEQQYPTIVEEESRSSVHTLSHDIEQQQHSAILLPQQKQKLYLNTGRRRSKSHPSILSETDNLQSLQQYPLLSDAILASSLTISNDALSAYSSSSSSYTYRKRRKTLNNKID